MDSGVVVAIYVVSALVWSVIWGVATYKVIQNKGYYENWFWWGFFFGFIALIVALAKPENRSVTDSGYSELLTAVASENEEREKQQILNKGGWKCKKCGRVNQGFIGTCGCGMSKSDNDAKIEAERVEAEKKEQSDVELQNLEKLKSYKELLDSGAITQEEFNKKKGELLNL